MVVFVALKRMRACAGSAAVLLTILAVFALEVAKGVVANDAGLISVGALPDAAMLDGEYWRVISFGFLHWDLTHLLLNSGLLLVAGPIAERRAGAGWLLTVFLISSMASGVGILLKHLLLPSLGASVGASGGMFGLLGFALVLVFRFPSPSRRASVRRGLAVFVAGAFVYSILPGISMVGHVVGFAVGIVAGLAVVVRDGGEAASAVV